LCQTRFQLIFRQLLRAQLITFNLKKVSAKSINPIKSYRFLFRKSEKTWEHIAWELREFSEKTKQFLEEQFVGRRGSLSSHQGQPRNKNRVKSTSKKSSKKKMIRAR
jgi:hypothetical protein